MLRWAGFPGAESGGTKFLLLSYLPTAFMIWVKQDRYEEITGKECLITLEPRPPYCDRGNWIAKLFPTGKLVCEIDEADAWPRYYFSKRRAKLEIEAWLAKRGQAVIHESTKI